MASHDNDFLAKVPLFSRLGPKELTAVRSMMTETVIPAGTVLATEGHTGHEFFVIVSGKAAVSRGGEHMADVGPGDFQGEISLLDGGPRTATVVATTDMDILVCTAREFSSLLDTAPMVARWMLPALAHRVRVLAEGSHTH